MTRFADRLSELGVRASSSKLGGIFYSVVCRRIDSVLIPLSRGRLSMGPPGQTVLITTKGARSGVPRRASLAFLWEGDDMVLVASKGGAPQHPAWYHNLKADPQEKTDLKGTEAARFTAMQKRLEALNAEIEKEGPDWWKRLSADGGRAPKK